MVESLRRAIGWGLLPLLLAACSPRLDDRELAGRREGALEARAREAIAALSAADYEDLSRLIHPQKGVRFSPEAFVDEARDQVFSAAEIARAAVDPSPRTWGAWDGSGEEIRLSFREYVERFVWDADFAAADTVAVDQRIGLSTTVDNIRAVYRDAAVVEFHVAGSDPRYEGMDWRSLRLVFERQDDNWFLVGVVHDQWSM